MMRMIAHPYLRYNPYGVRFGPSIQGPSFVLIRKLTVLVLDRAILYDSSLRMSLSCICRNFQHGTTTHSATAAGSTY